MMSQSPDSTDYHKVHNFAKRVWSQLLRGDRDIRMKSESDHLRMHNLKVLIIIHKHLLVSVRKRKVVADWFKCVAHNS